MEREQAEIWFPSDRKGDFNRRNNAGSKKEESCLASYRGSFNSTDKIIHLGIEFRVFFHPL